MAHICIIYICQCVIYIYIIYIHLPNDKPRAIIYELINLPAINELVTRPLGFRSRNAAFKWYNQVGYKVNWCGHEYIVGSPECLGGHETHLYRWRYIGRALPVRLVLLVLQHFYIAPGEYSLKLLEHINWRMHVQLISGFQKKTANPQTCAGSIRTGWWYTYPSEKYEFVSWDDEIPNLWKVIIHSCSKSTNQCRFNKATLW